MGEHRRATQLNKDTSATKCAEHSVDMMARNTKTIEETINLRQNRVAPPRQRVVKSVTYSEATEADNVLVNPISSIKDNPLKGELDEIALVPNTFPKFDLGEDSPMVDAHMSDCSLEKSVDKGESWNSNSSPGRVRAKSIYSDDPAVIFTISTHEVETSSIVRRMASIVGSKEVDIPNGTEADERVTNTRAIEGGGAHAKLVEAPDQEWSCSSTV